MPSMPGRVVQSALHTIQHVMPKITTQLGLLESVCLDPWAQQRYRHITVRHSMLCAHMHCDLTVQLAKSAMDACAGAI